MFLAGNKHLQILISLVFFVEARLKILSPQSLHNQYPDGYIQASYANFGYIPYGQTIMGYISWTNENDNFCDHDDMIQGLRTDDLSPVMVAIRGGCSFVQKIRNMEKIGVSVGIIIDNTNESIENLVMSDDGTGQGIRIPSMIISQKDGRLLEKWANDATEEELNNIFVMVEFVQAFGDDQNVVEFDFWYSSSNDRALDFLEDFAPLYKKLGDKVKMTPHFVFWECKNCNKEYIQNDCYGGGKYCAVEPTNNKIKGHEIVLEDLRQKCIYKETTELGMVERWFEYINKVHSQCYNVINEQCSQRAHKLIGLSWESTVKCVEGSFSRQANWSSKEVTNNIIDEEIAFWKQYGTKVFPSVVVNKKAFRGQLEPESVFNAICAGFQDPPEVCLPTLHRTTQLEEVQTIASSGEGISPGTIVAIVVAVVVFNIFAVLMCRRQQKRQIHGEMQMQIESAVSQYVALQIPNKTVDTSISED